MKGYVFWNLTAKISNNAALACANCQDSTYTRKGSLAAMRRRSLAEMSCRRPGFLSPIPRVREHASDLLDGVWYFRKDVQRRKYKNGSMNMCFYSFLITHHKTTLHKNALHQAQNITQNKNPKKSQPPQIPPFNHHHDQLPNNPRLPIPNPPPTPLSRPHLPPLPILHQTPAPLPQPLHHPHRPKQPSSPAATRASGTTQRATSSLSISPASSSLSATPPKAKRRHEPCAESSPVRR